MTGRQTIDRRELWHHLLYWDTEKQIPGYCCSSQNGLMNSWCDQFETSLMLRSYNYLVIKSILCPHGSSNFSFIFSPCIYNLLANLFYKIAVNIFAIFFDLCYFLMNSLK